MVHAGPTLSEKPRLAALGRARAVTSGIATTMTATSTTQSRGEAGGFVGSSRPVLLIGGSSSVGKTTVARDIAARHGWSLVQTDRELPDLAALHPLRGSTAIWDRPAEELCELLIMAASASVPHLTELVAQRQASGCGLIVEGERVHPELVHQLPGCQSLAAVFVVEADASRIFQTLLLRSREFAALAAERQRTVADVNRRYGQWLERECATAGLPCVPSQPWSTLAVRLMAAVRPTD